MGYLRRIEYTIMQKDSYKILRNCAGCGCKTKYISTKKFRVNANGKYIDVWLIYQCEKCKHTYNLSVHERIKVTDISKIEYKKFESNDLQYALDLGKNKQLFLKNKADIDWADLDHDIVGNDMEFKKGDYIVLCNPYQCKFRIDKLVSNILRISRNKAKSLEANGIIEIMHNHLEGRVEILIKAELFEVTCK